MKTEIIAIIDRSGSMGALHKEAIDGFNRFLKEQKATATDDRMTLVLFNDQYKLVYAGKAINKAEPLTELTYVPEGLTALNDAIAQTLDEQGKRIQEQGWADKVIVCILTDGHENCSKKHSTSAVKSMIEHGEKHGWTFVYLAANQDAFAVGAQYGFQRQYTQSFDATPVGTATAYRSMSSTVTQLKVDPAGGSISLKVDKEGKVTQ